ncbi:MAG: hypothetical protein EOO27_27320 [Comamonadaceae bacterium]|nr:MAG: hypothetical protein EOO27_27320 [Comamonadaceae bacterium]
MKVGQERGVADPHREALTHGMAPAAPGNIKPLLPYRLPIVLGNVLADPVARVEPGVRRRPKRCQTDDRIGAFAEFIAVTEDDVATKPGERAMEEAASSPLPGVTEMAGAEREGEP